MNYHKLFLIINCMLILGWSFGDFPPMHGAKKIIFQSHKNINKGFALKVDIVQIFSKAVMNQVKTMSAESFASKKQQLLYDNPDDIYAWEVDLINESMAKGFIVPHKNRYWGIIIFIHFIDQEPQKKVIIPESCENITLQFEDTKFKIVQSKMKTKEYEQLELNTEISNKKDIK